MFAETISGAPTIMIIWGVLIAVVLAFEIWMFVDALRNPRLDRTQRILWCVGMAFLHPLVAIAYYVLEYSNKGAR